jgi:hypothetical protein
MDAGNRDGSGNWQDSDAEDNEGGDYNWQNRVDDNNWQSWDNADNWQDWGVDENSQNWEGGRTRRVLHDHSGKVFHDHSSLTSHACVVCSTPFKNTCATCARDLVILRNFHARQNIQDAAAAGASGVGVPSTPTVPSSVPGAGVSSTHSSAPKYYRMRNSVEFACLNSMFERNKPSYFQSGIITF